MQAVIQENHRADVTVVEAEKIETTAAVMRKIVKQRGEVENQMKVGRLWSEGEAEADVGVQKSLQNDIKTVQKTINQKSQRNKMECDRLDLCSFQESVIGWWSGKIIRISSWVG